MVRLIAALGLLVVACRPPADNPTVTVAPERAPAEATNSIKATDTSIECHGMSWRIVNPDGRAGVEQGLKPTSEVTTFDGTLTEEFEDFSVYQGNFCGSLEPAGAVRILAYSRFTGGANCCFENIVVDLDSGEIIFRINGAQSPKFDFEQLDDEGALEVRTTYGGFANCFTSTVDNPFPTLILRWENGNFVPATKDFADLSYSDLLQTRRAFAEAPDSVGIVVHEWWHAHVAGEATSERASEIREGFGDDARRAMDAVDEVMDAMDRELIPGSGCPDLESSSGA